MEPTGSATFASSIRPTCSPRGSSPHDAAIIICTGLLPRPASPGSRCLRSHEARFLRLTFLVGVAIIGAAYGGILGNPLSDTTIDVLTSGPLQTFRNLYKFAPVVLLPLALGITHLASLAWNGRRSRGRLVAKTSAVLGLAALIVIGANPLLSDDFLGALPTRSRAFRRTGSTLGSTWTEHKAVRCSCPGCRKRAPRGD